MKHALLVILCLFVCCSKSTITAPVNITEWTKDDTVSPMDKTSQTDKWHVIVYGGDSLFLARHIYNDNVLIGSVYERGNSIEQITYRDSMCTQPIDTEDLIMSIRQNGDTLIISTETMGSVYFTKLAGS